MKSLEDKIKYLVTRAVISLCSIGLVACGGGGDDGGGGGYSGLTTPAEVTSSNAAEISDSALLASSANVGILSETDNENATSSGLANLTQFVSGVLSDRTVDNGKFVAQAMVSDSGSIPGSCGGNGSYNITINDVTLDFTMTLNFNNYCDAGVTISGSMNVSGSTNASATVMDMTMTGSQLEITENSAQKLFLYKNYTFNFDINRSNMVFDITGTFYHPDYGYVYCTTLMPFRIYNYDTYPSSGSLKIVEENANPDSATLTALNNVQYQIDIDFGNDGIIDESNIENWSSL